ncbi:hypothetical protein [Nocardia brevicatena]|uniref:hypothetical protein n=1 Tax=Nocardia brevicatena TaxID=37327 RepID=UPI0012FCC78A|nr:hypothetical protein [Nocardia brevicatena]
MLAVAGAVGCLGLFGPVAAEAEPPGPPGIPGPGIPEPRDSDGSDSGGHGGLPQNPLDSGSASSPDLGNTSPGNDGGVGETVSGVGENWKSLSIPGRQTEVEAPVEPTPAAVPVAGSAGAAALAAVLGTGSAGLAVILSTGSAAVGSAGVGVLATGSGALGGTGSAALGTGSAAGGSVGLGSAATGSAAVGAAGTGSAAVVDSAGVGSAAVGSAAVGSASPLLLLLLPLIPPAAPAMPPLAIPSSASPGGAAPISVVAPSAPVGLTSGGASPFAGGSAPVDLDVRNTSSDGLLPEPKLLSVIGGLIALAIAGVGSTVVSYQSAAQAQARIDAARAEFFGTGA